MEKWLTSVFVGNTGCICEHDAPFLYKFETNGIESDWIWLNIKPSSDITINFGSLFFDVLIGDATVVRNTSHIDINTNILNIMHFIDAIAKL